MSDEVPASAATPLAAWLAELAQPSGALGGGAASAVMLATSAALLRMVAEYTADDPRASACAERLASLRTDALDAAEDPDRDVRVRDAASAAARSSVSIGQVGRALISELRLITQISNPQLAADVAVGAAALSAGIAGASINLRADLQTARRHDAPSSVVTALEAEVRCLAEDRGAAADISEQVAQTFDR
jgi:formiminotetrahydrofolate cyclodeaminase